MLALGKAILKGEVKGRVVVDPNIWPPAVWFFAWRPKDPSCR